MVGRDMSTGYENLANIASCSAYKCRLSDVKQSCGDWRERRLCQNRKLSLRLRTSS